MGYQLVIVGDRVRKGARRSAYAGRAGLWPTPLVRVMRLGPGRSSAVRTDGCDNEPVIGG